MPVCVLVDFIIILALLNGYMAALHALHYIYMVNYVYILIVLYYEALY